MIGFRGGAINWSFVRLPSQELPDICLAILRGNIMRKLLLVSLVFGSLNAFADQQISLQVMIRASSPQEGYVILNEVEPGSLQALIQTLAPQANGKLKIKSKSRDISISCFAEANLSSCAVKVVQSSNLTVGKEGFASMNLRVDDFSGLKVLQNNPNLTIPFSVENKWGQRFNLAIGEGNFSISAVNN